jgi:hypothetical protein
MTAPTEPNRSVAHGVFTIERSYASVTPQRVFDAFSSIEGKTAGSPHPTSSGTSSSARWISGSVAASG